MNNNSTELRIKLQRRKHRSQQNKDVKNLKDEMRSTCYQACSSDNALAVSVNAHPAAPGTPSLVGGVLRLLWLLLLLHVVVVGRPRSKRQALGRT
jgi:hypothetical protein